MVGDAKMFISYSHKDKEWLRRLRVHLDPLLGDTHCNVFDDQQGLKPGDMWREKIMDALDSARVAVLLVSPDFLDSDFIMAEEWPRIENRAQKGDVTVLWFQVRPSVVHKTPIAAIQATGPDVALSSLGDAALDAALVELAVAIQSALTYGRPAASAPTGVSGVHQSIEVSGVVREFPINLRRIDACTLDRGGRIWLSTGQSIHVYDAGRDTVVSRKPLPRRRWKTWLNETWDDRLVLSDWDGSLKAFSVEDEAPGTEIVIEARSDSLPFHRLALGPGGELFAATWKGEVTRFDVHGNGVTATRQAVTPGLAVELLPLSATAIAVVTQDNTIRCFEEGTEVWRWGARAEIRSVCPCSAGVDASLVVLVGPDRLVQIQGGEEREELRLPNRVRILARRERGTRVQWLLAVDEQHRLHWVATSPLALDTDFDVDLGCPVREIEGVRAPGGSAALLAVALTEDGNVIAVNEHVVEQIDIERKYRRMVVDGVRHRLWLVSDSFLDVCASPFGFAALDGTVASPSEAGT